MQSRFPSATGPNYVIVWTSWRSGASAGSGRPEGDRGPRAKPRKKFRAARNTVPGEPMKVLAGTDREEEVFMSDDDEHGGGEHGAGPGDEHAERHSENAAEHGGGEHSAAGSVGDIAGGAGEVLGGVADLLGDGEDTEDAREGLETAEEIAEGVKKGAETAEALGKAANAIRGGNVGGAAGAIGDALGGAGGGVGALTGAIGGMVPDGEVRRGFQEASRVANTVGQIARGVGQIVEGASDLLGGLLGQRHPVHFELSIAGEDTHFTVRHVNLQEGLGRLYDGFVEATFPSSDNLDEQELLSKDIHLLIERGDEQRHFRGVIRHASIRRAQEHQVLNVDVAPALWLATQSLDSRVYQDLTVPELVEKVSNEFLGGRSRTVKRDLTQTYEKHEYLVQHRESHFDFISRLMREEGIFFYFDHDEDESEHEVLILADSNTNRPLVRPDHDGVVEYEEQENQREGREVAFHVHREQHVGPTDAVVRGYDWTNPGLNVHHERTERADWNGPRLEVYDHHHAVRHHGYDDGGGSYRSHTADRHSRLHTERLDLARNRWTVGTTVVTAQPGHVFELQGADTHDGRYLIVAMASSGGSEGHGGGEYTSSLEVIPADMPYRPPQPQRPSMPGPETATVVGPAGEEIYTDKHGRIKVQFHWDRQGQNDEHSSTWIRVAQGWAGTGWGFLFIPRIGMEVIVSFLGGDPDRPVVTGCLYNGTHPTPYALPDEKTKSTIKTNSSLGGGGSNELRFEDKKGSEEVYIHAEKDFNEVVENNHSTRVKNCQTNTVDVDQTETVGRDQTMTVKRDRIKTVDGNETTFVGGGGGPGNRAETVWGTEDVAINQNRTHVVTKDETLLVQEGKRTVTVETGKDVETYKGGRETTVSQFDTLTVDGGANRTTHVTGKYSITSDGQYKVLQNSINELTINDSLFAAMVGRIQLKAGDGVHYDAMPDGTLKVTSTTKIVFECGESSVELKADGTITVKGTTVEVSGGASSLKLEGSGATTSGPKITSSAQGVHEITGLLVKIN